MRSVKVELGELSLEALAGETERGGAYVPTRMVRAIRCYLHDRGAERPGWCYPSFLPEQRGGAESALELTIDEELWAEFEAEAERQGVTVRQLAEHAALYMAAELNAGRITERILDDLERGAG